jgi:hypothetical protein
MAGGRDKSFANGRMGELAARYGASCSARDPAFAWSAWLTPPITLFPLLLRPFAPFSIPGILTEYWQLYLLFFGVPWMIGALFWMHAKRVSERA